MVITLKCPESPSYSRYNFLFEREFPLNITLSECNPSNTIILQSERWSWNWQSSSTPPPLDKYTPETFKRSSTGLFEPLPSLYDGYFGSPFTLAIAITSQ
jgi:hypothetical protein